MRWWATWLLALCAPGAGADIPQVTEAFLSAYVETDNIDSPAVWHGPEGRHWVLATAKSAHTVVVYDAVSGEEVRRLGGPGDGPGQLARPNGIAVVEDVAIVVERDNKRVQFLRLPGGESLGFVGREVLERPYGMAVYRKPAGGYALYVTDNYETPAGELPPLAELGRRVRQFDFAITGDGVIGELVRTFGDTSAAGALRKVESIAVDPANDRLLIADEERLDIKIYTLDGRFTGEVMGRGVIRHEPEGMALYERGEKDCWVVTDQGDARTTFHLFARGDLSHRGTFSGARIANTDGIALTNTGFGPFKRGALYAVHDDGGVGALDWAAVERVLGIKE